MRYLFSVLLSLAAHCALAQAPALTKTEDVTTVLEQKVRNLSEAEVKEMNEISMAIQKNEKELAFNQLKPLLAKCEAREAESGKTIIYVDNAAQFFEYVALSDKKKDIVWQKDACPHTYKIAAFLFVSQGDVSNGFKYLDLAVSNAPFWAEPYVERGFLLGKTKDFPAAVKSYEKALSLAESHENSTYVKPMALRGLGFVLIELGELEKAKKAFQDSLQLEPNNRLAKNELEYIRQLEIKKKTP